MIPPPTGLRIRYRTSGVARRRPGAVASLVDLGSGGVIRCPHLGHLTPPADDLPRRGDARVQGLAWSENAVTIETETGSPCLLGPGGKRLPTRSQTALPRRARCLAGQSSGHSPAGGAAALLREERRNRTRGSGSCTRRDGSDGRRTLPGSTGRRAGDVRGRPEVLHRTPREGISSDAPARAEASEGGVHRLLSPGLRARPGRAEARRPRALPPTVSPGPATAQTANRRVRRPLWCSSGSALDGRRRRTSGPRSLALPTSRLLALPTSRPDSLPARGGRRCTSATGLPSVQAPLTDPTCRSHPAPARAHHAHHAHTFPFGPWPFASPTGPHTHSSFTRLCPTTQSIDIVT